ncbi:hypothetical protein BLS_006209 [Venturia inaequalis]|uniref:Uncharacterized protein n=1 Tax=Venturia inaequalis TaxID=5025 RepID=A0A8H3YNT4_VENIN|nr:hypothetical protein BLS_006209 [Venturia inaequalis]
MSNNRARTSETRSPKRPSPDPEEGEKRPKREKPTRGIQGARQLQDPQARASRPPTPPSAEAIRRTQILNSHRTRWTNRTNYDGRYTYWHGRPKGTQIEIQEDEYDRQLAVDFVYMAIVSVSEAIEHPLGQNPYSLLSVAQISSIYQFPEAVEETTVARPGRLLIFPWNFHAEPWKRCVLYSWKATHPLQQPKDVLEDKQEKGPESKNDDDPQSEKKAGKPPLQVDDPPRHTIMIVAEMFNGHPWFRVYNSNTAYKFDIVEMTFIVKALETIHWFPKPRSRPVPIPEMFTIVPTMNQYGAGTKQPCGIHTILNGWAVAMGLESLINPHCILNDDGYDSAIHLISLVVGGRADFWLIFHWMTEREFIYKPRKKTGRTISFQDVSLPANMDTEDHILSLFTEGGARYFDQSIPMVDDNHLDIITQAAIDREALSVLQTDAEQDQASAETGGSASRSSSEVSTTPDPELSNVPGSKSTLKEGIIHQISKAFQEITRGKTPPTLEELHKTLRGCSHLAWYLRQRLHHGPISGRECATRKSFEEIALEITGKTGFFSVPALLQVLTMVMHEMLDGEAALAPGVLSRKVQAIEEFRFPDEEDMSERGADIAEVPSVGASSV